MACCVHLPAAGGIRTHWQKISEERTSQLDWVAPKIIKRVFIRPRYVKQERFALAPLPPQPIKQRHGRAVWSPVSLSPVIINGQNVVTNPLSGAPPQFFRLGM
jgi:hypothetical protein